MKIKNFFLIITASPVFMYIALTLYILSYMLLHEHWITQVLLFLIIFNMLANAVISTIALYADRILNLNNKDSLLANILLEESPKMKDVFLKTFFFNRILYLLFLTLTAMIFAITMPMQIVLLVATLIIYVATSTHLFIKYAVNLNK